MSYTTTLSEIPFDALVKASEFVREKYKLDRVRIICEEFETEFNVKLSSPDFILNFEDDIEFRSEAEYIIFLLRLS